MRPCLFVLVVAVITLASACASPTDTLLPPPTLPPTLVQPTDVPTATPVPATVSPEAIEIAEPTASAEPSAEAEPVAQARPLVVGFDNLHYECVKGCEDGSWTYRRAQYLMVVENRSSSFTLAGGQDLSEGWEPTTVFVTNGVETHSRARIGQWIQIVDDSDQDPWRRPDLPPGARGEWTFLAVPLDPSEWVAAVEYVDEWGNMYRQEFPKPEGGAFNYVDCGAPTEGSC